MRNKTSHTPLTRGSRLPDAKLLLIITDQFYFYFSTLIIGRLLKAVCRLPCSISGTAGIFIFIFIFIFICLAVLTVFVIRRPAASYINCNRFSCIYPRSAVHTLFINFSFVYRLVISCLNAYKKSQLT